jgi:hypothetical protein
MPVSTNPPHPALPKRRLLLCSLAGAPFCRAGAAPAGPALNDQMVTFWPLYDAARMLPAKRRAPLLLSRFFEPRRALYASAGIPLPDAGLLERWLDKFDPNAAAIRQTHARFAADFRRVAAGFQAACPDFDGAASPVYLLPSLGWFDGHAQPDGASLPLFFGVDEIARRYGAQLDLRVLMAHELFHCYQGQGNPALFMAKTGRCMPRCGARAARCMRASACIPTPGWATCCSTGKPCSTTVPAPRRVRPPRCASGSIRSTKPM